MGKIGIQRRWSDIPAILPDAVMNFEIIGRITEIEIVAVGAAIREVERLRRTYGTGRWRKLKGIARVRLADESTCSAEVPWYEAHGIGRKEFKIKRLLGE